MRRCSFGLVAALLVGAPFASCRWSGKGDIPEIRERFLYVCDDRLPGIVSFRLDEVAGTVTLAATSVLELGTTPRRLTISPSGRTAFGLPGGGVLAYSLAPGGSVSVLTRATARLPASSFVLAPNELHLYTITRPREVAAFEVGPDGAFAPIGTPLKVGGAAIGIAIDRAGRTLHVLTKAAEPGMPPEVVVLGIDPATGALSPPAVQPLRVGAAASIIVHPSGRFGSVLQDDYDGKIDVYEVDPSGAGTPRRVAGSPFASGARPLRAEYHPSGRFLYVLASSAVWAYGVDAAGGLTALPGSPVELGVTPWHLSLDPDGRFLYTATPGNSTGSLGVWAIDPELGTLSEVSGSPFICGRGPVFVARRPGARVEVATLAPPHSIDVPSPHAESGNALTFGLAEASTSELASQLKNGDWRVRYQAAVYLSSKGPDAALAVPALTAALGDANEPVAQRAAYALEKIGHQSAPAVPALIVLLEDESASLRRAAASALGSIGSIEARDALARAMQRPGFGVGSQSQAALALGTIGATPEHVPALLAVIAGDDPKTREAAVEMLGRLGPAAESAVPDLVLLLDHDRADVRKAAATALGRLGPRAGASIPTLYGGLLDEAPSVRSAASRAIQSIRQR